ncbi:MAG: glycoside hydrolase 43 family protein [Chthoniobacteraceae bacterium]
MAGHKIPFVLVLLCLGCVGATLGNASDNGDGTFTNPVLNADYPDCDVIRVADDYYFISSSMHFSPSDPILHSKDLVNWEVIGYAIPRYETKIFGPTYDMGDGDAYGKGSWAPCIRYHDGTFYVLFTVPSNGPAAGTSYISRATNPAGPWTINSLGVNLYDPGLFFDDNGKVYVVHGQQRICCTELTPELTGVKIPPKEIFHDNVEGSHVYKRNGFYYVLNPGSGREHCYRSKSLFGPYEHRVILDSGGIHQGGIMDTQTGEWWGIFFQDRPPLGRIPNLEPVTWIDDWPMVGENGKGVVTFKKPDVGKSYSPVPMKRSDEFDSPTLGMQWQWNHNPVDSAWSLTERSGYLRLKTASVAPYWRNTLNTLTQRVVSPRSVVTTKLDVSGMKDGDVAGLGVMQSGRSCIAVTQVDGARSLEVDSEIWNRRTKQITRTVAMTAPLTGHDVWLKAEAEVSTSGSRTQYFYSTDGQQFTPLGDKQPMVLDFYDDWTGQRIAIFNYATQALGGSVDVDWFHFN